MGFLAPAFLALAVLAGVPLLVHLLRRRVGRVIEFPAVRYLMRMEQEHSRELKLRHRLLLLLRVFAVVAVAVAAARPMARLTGLGHAPVAIAVLVDNSMSSGAVRDGRSVLDVLRGDARSLLGALTEADRAWIVTVDGRVVGGSTIVLLQALSEIQPLGGRGNLPSATRRAIALARSGAPRASVVALLSDGQPNAFDVAGDSTVGAGEVPVVALVHPHTVFRNRSVVAVDATPTRWTPGGTVSFQIASPDSSAWRIALDGRTVARGTVGASAVTSPARLTQRLASTSTGWLRGSVEVDPDELRGDDARWFAVRVASLPSVAVRTDAGPFVTAALNTLVDEARLARGSEGSSGVVSVASADAASVRGPVLLAAPSDPLRVGEANRTLTRLGIPWRFGAIARDLVLARDVTRASNSSAVTLDGTQVRTRYPLLRTGAGGVALASDTLVTAGGAPWVVAGANYVLVASPLEPEATDLPLRAVFLPWLLEVLSKRLGDEGRVVHAHPGEHLAGMDGLSALERPDGSLIALSGDRVTVPNAAGVYFLRRQAARVGALVVNAEAEESDVGSQPPVGVKGASPFLSRVTGRSVAEESDGGRWRTRVLEQASGRSLLNILLLIALAAVVLEAWVSRLSVASRSV